MPTHPDTTALLVIDLQPDFMPGGALPCHEGDAVVPVIAALVASRAYRTVVATQDWHPPGHASFASSHAGRDTFETIELHGHPQVLWPDHCVQGTPGAALDPRVDWHLADLILRKGTRPQVDSYRAFRENIGPDGLRPPTAWPAGCASAASRKCTCAAGAFYCVLWSAQDAMAVGLRARVLWDLTRP